MPESSTQPPVGQARADQPVDGRSLYQEGEYWTVVYEGAVFRLRNAKGLHCLAFLLKHPGQKFSAVELLALTEPRAACRPPAAPAIDAADVEEARVVVTKRITAIVKKIQVHHPSLGHHLRTCVKTGSSCVYLCDPERPVRWVT